jgi:hypothetical protein
MNITPSSFLCEPPIVKALIFQKKKIEREKKIMRSLMKTNFLAINVNGIVERARNQNDCIQNKLQIKV